MKKICVDFAWTFARAGKRDAPFPCPVARVLDVITCRKCGKIAVDSMYNAAPKTRWPRARAPRKGSRKLRGLLRGLCVNIPLRFIHGC